MIRERLASPALLAGVAVWAASLALYLSTLAPTLTWGHEKIGVDGGEFLAAANTFGVPHPPGYPTYTILLKLFAWVVPVGDFAHRGNLLSAVLASLSVGLLYWVILRFCRFLWPDGPRALWIISAALGAAIFATAPLFWSQAIITEVYALNALFAVVLLLIASHLALRLPTEQVAEGRVAAVGLGLFGFLLGIGLGNHFTLLAVAVPLVFWLWATLGWKKLASPWLVGAFILGLGIYVYLLIRAAQDPPINWGNANTLDGMAWMLSGRVYQDYVFGVPAESILERFLSWLDMVFSQFNPLGIFMGLAGAAALRSRELKFFAASLASIALISVYSITYNTVDAEVFTIPALLLFSVWIGIGVFWTLSGVYVWAQSARESLRPAAARVAVSHSLILLSVIAFGALPFTSVILNYSSQNLRGDDGAYQYARQVIDLVPDGSVVMSSREDQAFSLWYMRYVEETDRDVAPVAVPLLQFDWYWRSIHARFPDRFPADGPTDVKEAVKSIVAHNDGGATTFFTSLGPSFADFELEDLGAVWEARPKTAP